MRQRFPGHVPLLSFTDAECRAMHIACTASHNAGLIADIQTILPLFYADAYRGGFFRDTYNGYRLYREPAPRVFALLCAIAQNELANFMNVSADCGGCREISSPQEHWRALSSVISKLSVARGTSKKGAH